MHKRHRPNQGAHPRISLTFKVTNLAQPTISILNEVRVEVDSTPLA
jgi:hypothetical protein